MGEDKFEIKKIVPTDKELNDLEDAAELLKHIEENYPDQDFNKLMSLVLYKQLAEIKNELENVVLRLPD